MTEQALKALAIYLFDAGAVQIGDIEAKAGRRTPIYFDLRVVISNPKLMMLIAKHLENLTVDINYDLICGVPYAALPLAAVMSVNTNIPMIMKRKERKEYATRKILEGIFHENQKCLIVEDVVTSGGSVQETVNTLRAEGLRVTDTVVVLDCDQGGVSVLKANGVRLKSIFSLKSFVKVLHDAGRIGDDTVNTIIEHIKRSQFGKKITYDTIQG